MSRSLRSREKKTEGAEVAETDSMHYCSTSTSSNNSAEASALHRNSGYYISPTAAGERSAVQTQVNVLPVEE
jgi:hypothetical protein